MKQRVEQTEFCPTRQMKQANCLKDRRNTTEKLKVYVIHCRCFKPFYFTVNKPILVLYLTFVNKNPT